MSEREWCFYVEDMINFAENVQAYTSTWIRQHLCHPN